MPYLLGVEVATAHWEFMYGIERVRELFGDAERRGLFAGDFVAQNVSEAGFGDRIFKPYTVRHVGGVNVAVIGQAFPYTVVAHPKRLVGDLTFGIREDQRSEEHTSELQSHSDLVCRLLLEKKTLLPEQLTPANPTLPRPAY